MPSSAPSPAGELSWATCWPVPLLARAAPSARAGRSSSAAFPPGPPAATKKPREQASRHRHCPKSSPWLWLRSAMRASTHLLPGTWAKGSCGGGAGPPCAPLPAGRDVRSTRGSDGQERCALLAHAGRQVPAQACPVGRVRRGQQNAGEPVPVGRGVRLQQKAGLGASQLCRAEPGL